MKRKGTETEVHCIGQRGQSSQEVTREYINSKFANKSLQKYSRSLFAPCKSLVQSCALVILYCIKPQGAPCICVCCNYLTHSHDFVLFLVFGYIFLRDFPFSEDETQRHFSHLCGWISTIMNFSTSWINYFCISLCGVQCGLVYRCQEYIYSSL